jgi:hypothetical protein
MVSKVSQKDLDGLRCKQELQALRENSSSSIRLRDRFLDDPLLSTHHSCFIYFSLANKINRGLTADIAHNVLVGRNQPGVQNMDRQLHEVVG